MIRANEQVHETEANELSEVELNQVAGGIIAVRQEKMCDGSVMPAPQAQKALIGLL